MNIDGNDCNLEKLVGCLQKNELFPRNNTEIIYFLARRMGILKLIEGNQSLFEYVLKDVGGLINTFLEQTPFWNIFEMYSFMWIQQIREKVDEYPFGNLVEFLTAVSTLYDLPDLSAKIIEAVDHLAEDTKISFLAPFLKHERYYLPCSKLEVVDSFLEKLGFAKVEIQTL